MRRYALIDVPYHLGVAYEAVGGGPGRLLDAGAAAVFAQPAATGVRWSGCDTPELERIAAVNERLATAVRDASAAGNFPIVLAGNCNSCVGTLAGLHGDRKGIVWLDAHGDFHTPDTSVSGLIEGMSLAIAAGHCHAELALRSGLERPVSESNILLLAVRDLDPDEEWRLEASAITTRHVTHLDGLPEMLAALGERSDSVYFHIDADVLDSEESPGVNWHSPGGLRVADAADLVESIAAMVPIGAAAVTNYNPDRDPEGRSAEAILHLLAALRRGLES